MLFYTTSTFRLTFAALTKKSKDGYVDLTEAEYDRLLMEMVNESKAGSLHQVDIANGLTELSQNACLPGDK